MKSNAKVSASRSGVLFKNLARRMQAVADVAHGMHQGLTEGLIDLRPQPADVGIDDAGLRIELEVPDAFEQHRSGYNTALVPHQHFEEREFSRLQLDRLARSLGGAPDQIEFQVGNPQHYLLRLNRRPAQQSV